MDAVNSSNNDSFVMVAPEDFQTRSRAEMLFAPAYKGDEAKGDSKTIDPEVVVSAKIAKKWLSEQKPTLHTLLPPAVPRFDKVTGEEIYDDEIDAVMEVEIQKRRAYQSRINDTPKKLDLGIGGVKKSEEVKKLLLIAEARFGVIRRQIADVVQPSHSPAEMESSLRVQVYNRYVNKVYEECLKPAARILKKQGHSIKSEIKSFHHKVCDPAMQVIGAISTK